MLIHIQGFDKHNNFISKKIDTQSQPIEQLKKWSKYDWYYKNELLSPSYNMWKDDTYIVSYNHHHIKLNITHHNKQILTPLISTSITIHELKDILSIKDNIFFLHSCLSNDKTLKYYNINNFDNLYVLENIYDTT
jgi:hypothetical protein